MNTFAISCPHCGQSLEADEALVGQTVECPSCGKSFAVDAPETPAQGQAPEAENAGGSFTISCPNCGQALEADVSLVGSSVACPSCGKPFSVPRPASFSRPALSNRIGEDPRPPGNGFLGAVLGFLKKEQTVETDVSSFAGRPEETFELKRLFPLAVCCLAFGWIVSGFFNSTCIRAETRWEILPLAALALWGTIRSMFHFIRPKNAHWGQWIAIALFTATAGLFLLEMFQHFAELTASQFDAGKFKGRKGAFDFLTLFVGKCYRMTESKDYFERFLGFVGGVGLCEEATKTLPLLVLVWLRKKHPSKIDLSFRSFLAFGFFSGLGFGIGEALSDSYGISFARHPGTRPDLEQFAHWGYYDLAGFEEALSGWNAAMAEWNVAVINSVLGNQMTRWFACVSLHAVYSVVDAAFLWFLYRRIKNAKKEYSYIGWLVLCIGVMALVHGVYDVLCSMPNMGIAIDGASLVLLWWIVRRAATKSPDEDFGTDNRLDFRRTTVATFGKSFTKMYLGMFAGVLLYYATFCD